MPIKVAAGAATTFAAFSMAGAGAIAPFALMHPGTQDRLEAQTNKWAPRWEKGIHHFTKPIERGVKAIEPPIARTVQSIEQTLPLEQAAKAVDRRIRRSIDGIDSRNKRVQVGVRLV
ncbi:hypothetical protein MKZ38_002199 [Zalerion maritima]|uniref:Uncharacterized protein n=1 Tax=Zalerion maritima TaxID=339359 RepID=A0AAD5RQI8_9PEZI|nr:hypothetical protein MKZ38_002199 [Zalerion maritima]